MSDDLRTMPAEERVRAAAEAIEGVLNAYSVDFRYVTNEAGERSAVLVDAAEPLRSDAHLLN